MFSLLPSLCFYLARKAKPLASSAALLTLSLFIFSPSVSAQSVTEVWTKRFNGTGSGNDYAQDIAVDGSGNVYVVGYTHYLGGPYNDDDYRIIKYSAAGDELWNRIYDGPSHGNDRAGKIVLDAAGNLYVTGLSYTTGQGNDYATVKYNALGTLQWASRYNGPGNGDDEASDLVVDASGNVYVTGKSFGLGTDTDYATIKYNSAGVQQWVRRYDGTGSGIDYATALTLNPSGTNLYVTGASQVHSASYDDYDYVTLKYDAAGNQQWVSRYDGPGVEDDIAKDIVANATGVYITGSSVGDSGDNNDQSDFATIKYNTSGVQQWVQRYNDAGNGTDEAVALALDASGNVIVAGHAMDSPTDFWSSQFVAIKYNASGTQQWLRTYDYSGSPYSDNFVHDLALDGSGNVYLTGSFSDGTFGQTFFGTVKFSSAGIYQWVKTYNSAGADADMANAIAISGGNVYVTGYSEEDATKADMFTIKYIPAVTPTTLNINCGGPLVNTAGVNYIADKYFSATSAAKSDATVGDIIGTTSDALFYTYRNAATAGGSFSYDIPVTNGTYKVRLRFAEIYYTTANQRKFNVNLEGGATELSNFDIFTAAGGTKTEINKTFTITVTDGTLNIAFSSVIGKAVISAIQITPANLNPTRLAEEETLMEDMGEPVLSTGANPFYDHLSVSFKVSKPGVTSLKVFDMQGREVQQLFEGEAEANQNYDTEWTPANQQAGMYILRFVTQGQVITKKVLFVR